MPYRLSIYFLLLSLGHTALSARGLNELPQEDGRQTLVIRVLNQDGRQIRAPVRVTMVAARGAGRHSLLLSDGRVGRIVLPPGDYSLRTDAEGFREAEQTLRLAGLAASTHYIDLRLLPAAKAEPADAAPVHIEELLIPPKARKHFLKAQEASDAGNYEKALKHLAKASKHCPKCPQAHNNRGVIYLRLSRWQEAEEAFRQALQLKPDSSRALHNLALLLRAQQRDEEAEEILRRLAQAPDRKDGTR
ncbi:MAG TPA: tetratricopeptide repeat protein [Acidobacteriota bacterium]|nr:tetratricopeptide repeat protein [Acidobacteriota bacterium]